MKVGIFNLNSGERLNTFEYGDSTEIQIHINWSSGELSLTAGDNETGEFASVGLTNDEFERMRNLFQKWSDISEKEGVK